MEAYLNPWNEALRLRTVLAAFGVVEGEIAFPETAAPQGAQDICLVSEAIAEAPALTPTQLAELRETLWPFRIPLRGRSIRLAAGTVDLLVGDSGDFLVPWFGN
jgi:hypothetical protein